MRAGESAGRTSASYVDMARQQFLTAANALQADEDDAQCGEYWNRKEHPGNARDPLSSEHAEQHQHRMQFHAGTHQVWRQHVVLEQPEDCPEEEKPDYVSVSAQ